MFVGGIELEHWPGMGQRISVAIWKSKFAVFVEWLSWESQKKLCIIVFISESLSKSKDALILPFRLLS